MELPKHGDYFEATSTCIDIVGMGEHSTSVRLLFRVIGTGLGHALECTGWMGGAERTHDCLSMADVAKLFKEGKCGGLSHRTYLSEPRLLSAAETEARLLKTIREYYS